MGLISLPIPSERFAYAGHLLRGFADGRYLLNIDDRIVPGYRALARAVHEEGELMLAQLAHVGAMEAAGDAILSASPNSRN